MTPFAPKDWKDSPDASTPINQASLEDLESRLAAYADSGLSGKADTSALTAHTNNTANPHAVTKTQVGLGSVDNTSDVAKPVSTATQTALNGKVGSSTITTIWSGTQAAYDAIGSKNAATLYVISG